MKVVSLIDNEFFTRGRIYSLMGTSFGDEVKCVFNDKLTPHIITLDYIFNNFSVLTFDPNLRG